MGMTINQQQLIRAVAENDLKAARQYAKICLGEDKTQKNRYFVAKYKNVLENLPTFKELPTNLKDKLIVEDVRNSFLVGRYYISDREKELFETIYKMKIVADKLAEKRIRYINATMLNGVSGTGKTTFGRYVAYKLGLPFCYVNFSNIINSYMGKTSENLFLIFNYIKGNPCVLMLDEVDCIAMQRGKAGDGGADGELSRTTISLMQEFDQLPNDIIVISATNRIDKIDPAFLRRFSINHEVRKLSKEESLKMARCFLADVEMNDCFSDDDLLEIIESEDRVQGRIINKIIREIGNIFFTETNKGETK